MKRPTIPKKLQIEIFRRNRWLCYWCGYPVIFAPAMRYLENFTHGKGITAPLAYHHPHWTRRDAPLLDHMGAVIDHVAPHRGGGKSDSDNLVTACCKCNALKSAQKREEFERKLQRHRVKGKYGEPAHWDGLSALFVVLIEDNRDIASASELDWLKHLKPNTTTAVVS